jgi:hypothetical protein
VRSDGSGRAARPPWRPSSGAISPTCSPARPTGTGIGLPRMAAAGRASSARREPCGEPVEADHRAGYQQEREPPPTVPVPAHLQPPPAAQPGQRPLDLPPVPPKPGRGLHPTAGDPRPDPTPAQVRTVGRAVVGLVGVDLARSSAPLPRWRANRQDIVKDRFEHRGVIDVGGSDHDGKWLPATVAHHVELASRLATIDGICAHVVPPRLARTLAESTLARVQSSRPAVPSWSRILRWRASNTPALAHSVSRR